MSQLGFLVSIILPAYNAEKYINTAIDSVISQSYRCWELLIIDDGSSDDTSDICGKYEKKDDRIKVITTKNQGVSAARNKGLEISLGKYITFLDADDMLPTDSLKARVEYLESNPNIDVVDGVVLVMDSEMENEIRRYVPYFDGILLPKLARLDEGVFFNVCYMFRGACLSAVRFDENVTHAEDLIFFVKLSQANKATYASIPSEVYSYRKTGSSAMSNLSGLQAGYKAFLVSLGSCDLTVFQILFARLKTAKIVLACWVGAGQHFRGLLAFFSVLFTKS